MLSYKVIDREGPEDFATTLAFQQNTLNAKCSNRSLLDTLILVEHEHIYTTGRGVSAHPSTMVDDVQPEWVEIGRGGEATYHGPGQIVAYPIFDLEHHGKDVHVFLRKLEQVIIRALAEFEIEGFCREGLTGVWVTQDEVPRKIASIGIGVRRWVSHHGLALNVNNDLRFFQQISPCGQDGSVMTSIENFRASQDRIAPSMEEVKNALCLSFESVFQLQRDESSSISPGKRPSWLKVKAPGSPKFQETMNIIKPKGLVTVCEEARCPNIGECWSHHTATFMIMGELCTRRCAFCSVKDGVLSTLDDLDPFEPIKVAKAVAELGLKHVVITSVNRDDLEDMGAAHFFRTARAIHNEVADCNIEFLIPDLRGRRALLETILTDGHVAILNHNLETVPRLYRTVRPGANYKRSLNVLRWAKEIDPKVKTKCGIMVGVGERREEVFTLMDDLREAGVEIMTIGQYLQPSQKQLPIKRYVTPDEFEEYRIEGEKRGFSFVESGPFVRSSYHAWKHTTPEGESPSTRTEGYEVPAAV